MNSQHQRYFRWLCALCVVMLLFTCAVLIVGYKDLSMGRGATMALLVILSIVFGVLGWKKKAQ